MEIEKLTAGKLVDYRKKLSSDIRRVYSVASDARKLGKDVTDRVEVPLASDMAARIEALLEVDGLAEIMRKMPADLSREEVAIGASKEVAKLNPWKDRRKALDIAVRVGLAILTEGILVAPLEGIRSVDIRGDPGREYVAVVYSGPIRSAGGTAQALSVLIADIVRRDLGIGEYNATEDEIERNMEEIQSYNRLKHLQYLPSDEEIRLVVSNAPVMIDGEGSEDEEISGHRDMERISTNRIRGGMCLVLCEGLIQKSKKVLKYTSKLNLNEWSFLERISGSSKSVGTEKKDDKFLKDIIAGRPVFSHPGRPGGFRLRYGRSRLTGLAAAGINPATMELLDGFIAVGSQIKIELPGKAAAVTPCETIDGPMVMLSDGRHIRVNDAETARAVKNQVTEITDIGEILIGYGEFLENNHKLEKPSFCREWWLKLCKEKFDSSKYAETDPDQFEAVMISKKYGLPLHPQFDYFWHDLDFNGLRNLRKSVLTGSLEGDEMRFPADGEIVRILKSLGIPFSLEAGYIAIKEYYPMATTLGITFEGSSPVSLGEPVDSGNMIETLEHLSGLKIVPKSPTRIGARMGRPEKAGARKMKPLVHVLFPVEDFGTSRRSIGEANLSSNGDYISEALPRACVNCGNITITPLCEKCGGRTAKSERKNTVSVNISEIIKAAEDRVGITLEDVKLLKGVKKLMSSRKACEPLEKGILRAKNDVSVNKDGTCRYDVSDLPLTHFVPSEIGMSDELAFELGYVPGKLNEIYPQDVIIPYDAGDYLLKVSNLMDDLLSRYYKLSPFYSCKTREDLIGKSIIGLAPHTSGGIAGRIIGFTRASGAYAHPLFHAAKRRNCDGDEDSLMLMLDGLVNFSKEFLPATTGGQMDAPLVLTEFLSPEEVDKEVLNVDTLWEYPLEFYQAAERGSSPSEIEKMMKPLKRMIEETGSYAGLGFTNLTRDLNSGVMVSSYKTIGTMEEKIERQLNLAGIIRAVDRDDVAARVLNSHFLPDIYGNFRGFFSQTFRCTKCNKKYRRITLSGKCIKCGSDKINLTVHKGGIVKYLDETIKIAEQYRVPDYLKARIYNIKRTIDDTFGTDETEPELRTLEV